MVPSSGRILLPGLFSYVSSKQNTKLKKRRKVNIAAHTPVITILTFLLFIFGMRYISVNWKIIIAIPTISCEWKNPQIIERINII